MRSKVSCAVELRNLMDEFKEEREISNQINYCEIVNKYALLFQRTVVVLVAGDVAEI